jgi:hypothetical protein
MRAKVSFAALRSCFTCWTRAEIDAPLAGARDEIKAANTTAMTDRLLTSGRFI